MPSGVKLLEGYVEVTADGKAAAKQVADDVESSPDADRAGKGFGKKLVGGIVGSIAVVKIGQFIGDSISAGTDLAETINKSNAIFGDQAGAIEAWGNTAATTLGLSKAAALDAAAGFGNMLTQLGYLPDDAAAVSQSIVGMAADLGSFNNLPTADVTDRISAALRGEYDSLQALIPNINAARVEQEAMAATGKTNASELTAQEKAAATLAIINKDGATAMGDFANTAESAANQQKIAAAQTEDLKASLGDALLPVVQDILGVVTSQFLPMLQDFAKFITENEQAIVPLAIGLGVLAAAIWVVNVAMYANPVGLIIAGIILLIGIIVLLVTQWDTVVAFLTDVWNGFINWIMGVITQFAGYWILTWQAIGQFISDVWNGFINWIVSVWSGFIGWLVGIVSGIVGWWNGLWAGIGAFFTGIWNGIVSFARGAVQNLISFFTGLPGQIMGALSGAATWLLNVGRDIVAGLREGIAGAWRNLVSWFSGLFGNIIDIAKKILGIASPSKVFKYEVGYMLPKGAEEGIELGMPSLNRTIANMIVPPEVDPGAYGVGTGPSYAGAGFGSVTQHNEITVVEAEDPLGTVGRIGRELKKWKAA
jgi:hypothetical protein